MYIDSNRLQKSAAKGITNTAIAAQLSCFWSVNLFKMKTKETVGGRKKRLRMQGTTICKYEDGCKLNARIGKCDDWWFAFQRSVAYGSLLHFLPLFVFIARYCQEGIDIPLFATRLTTALNKKVNQSDKWRKGDHIPSVVVCSKRGNRSMPPHKVMEDQHSTTSLGHP